MPRCALLSFVEQQDQQRKHCAGRLMAFAPGLIGTLPEGKRVLPVSNTLGHLPYSHRISRQQPAQPCRLRHCVACSSTNSLWGSSLHCSKQRHGKQQRRGQSLVVHAAQDYYSVLGVEKNADKQAIKTAYRQKARKFHPDVNKEPGAEDTFKTISSAYEVLSDENKRSIYDRLAISLSKSTCRRNGSHLRKMLNKAPRSTCVCLVNLFLRSEPDLQLYQESLLGANSSQ